MENDSVNTFVSWNSGSASSQSDGLHRAIMRTEFRKAAIAIFAFLSVGVAHAKTADLAREGSLYICPDDILVNGQLSLLASECLQDGARFGAPQLIGGNAQGALNPSLEPFWKDDLYLYNPLSGAYTFLGAFITPMTSDYSGESPFEELPFDVKTLVISFINHGYSIIDFVWQSDSALYTFTNSGSFGQFAFEPSSVPETATWMMMLVGFGAMGAAIRVTRRKNGLALAM
jgi:PEP-CTERM motif